MLKLPSKDPSKPFLRAVLRPGSQAGFFHGKIYLEGRRQKKAEGRRKEGKKVEGRRKEGKKGRREEGKKVEGKNYGIFNIEGN